MAGIYIHIPFCKQACNYCNFHFTTSLRYKNELIAALLAEIKMGNSVHEPVDTIYLGGGTPSILDTAEIAQIITAVYNKYIINNAPEITLEANPDDITTEKLIAWQNAGVNRLSIGVQSFFDEDLQWMHRAHNAQQALNNVALARSFFNNITIDLIYGVPGLDHTRWQQNIETAISMQIPHLSCYALTVEPQTPLYKQIEKHRKKNVNDAHQSEQFLILMDRLAQAGYEHYEISNFALPGFYSRHNSAYWQARVYYGFGPGAHSYNGSKRWWNVSNNHKYITAINSGSTVIEEEELLTPWQKINESIMIGLRTAKGFSLDILPTEELKKILPQIHKHIQSGLLLQQDDKLQLTREGKLLADGIIADLFV